MEYNELEDEEVIRLAIEAQAAGTKIHPAIITKLSGLGLLDVIVLGEPDEQH